MLHIFLVYNKDITWILTQQNILYILSYIPFYKLYMYQLIWEI